MSAKNFELALKALDVFLAGLGLLDKLGINYREVIDAKDRAKAEGRDYLTAEERQPFLDQSQAALDKL